MRRLLPALVLAISSAAAGRAASAQQLSGVLTLRDGASPAGGVILVVESPRGDSVLSRSITAPDGRFVVRLPAREVRLRALRIGHRPTFLGTVHLAEGERRVTDFRLADAPIVLTAVTTRAAARCELVAGAGVQVADLFEETRKTLLASLLTSPDGPAAVRVVVSDQLTDLSGESLGPPRRRVRSGLTAKPFRSLPPGLLAVVGYVSPEGDFTVYRAPDAAVILSESFAATHCLQVAEGRGARAGMIGLNFRPVGRAQRDIIRIRGTLWIERASLELQLLEYEYVGLPSPLDRLGLGGNVAFTRLDDGMVFESAWEIRMPRTALRGGSDRTALGLPVAQPTLVVEAIQRTRGDVLSISRGESPVYVGATALDDSLRAVDLGVRAATGADAEFLSDTVSALGRCADEIERLAARSAAPEPRATIYGVVSEAPSTRVEGATVNATWKENFKLVGATWSWIDRARSAVTAEDGFYALCDTPRQQLVTLQATKGDRRSNKLALRVPMEQARARADLTLRTTP